MWCTTRFSLCIFMVFSVNQCSFEILEMNGCYRAYLLGYLRTRTRLICKHESERYAIHMCVEMSKKVKELNT